VDYSTSGLENPLSNLLLALFLFVYFRAQQGSRRLLLLSLIASLAAVNRPDALLLFIPALLWEFWENRSWKAVRVALLGSLPLFLWEAFSLFYYGFLFSNTAYARLNTDLSIQELASQGWRYAGSSMNADPITPLVILAGVSAAFVAKTKRPLLICVGVVVYLTYVASIGGDSMRGRLFTMPLLASVVLLSALRLDRPAALFPAIALVSLVGLTTRYPTVVSISDYGADRVESGDVKGLTDRWGVSDERACYYQATGLLAQDRFQDMPDSPWAREGAAARNADAPVVTRDTVGFFGFYASRRIHVVDTLGLADPLLARLAPEPRFDWRVGHFPRHLPQGYVETLISGENKLANRDLAHYYDKLRYVIAAPLWAPRRFVEIAKLNVGAYDALLHRYEDSRFAHLSYDDVARGNAHDAALDPAGNFVMPPAGAKISIGRVVHAQRVVIVLDVRQAYWVVFRKSGSVVARRIVEDVPGADGLKEHVVELGDDARKGYDEIALLTAGRRAQQRPPADFLFKGLKLLE
jgi:arabinofuranosyltransferase